MWVTVVQIVIGALETIPKDLVRKLEELKIRERTDTTAFLSQPEYEEESWKLEETYCHSDYSERLSANAGMKSSQVHFSVLL